jgi:hypothetical protein
MRDVLALVILMAMFIVATSPELVGEWQATKDVAYDEWMVKNAPEFWN